MKIVKIKDDATAEIVVNKSKFIAFAIKTNDEQSLQDSLKRLRKTYYDATHVCYAAVWDDGNSVRSSDDGEPSGTDADFGSDKRKKSQTSYSDGSKVFRRNKIGYRRLDEGVRCRSGSRFG